MNQTPTNETKETTQTIESKTKDTMDNEIVAILDAGAQYGKVIDRRVRELNVLSEIRPLWTPVEKLKKYKAIIITGGPQSVYSSNAPKFDPKLFELDKPVLGLCYGMQLINYVFGGRVERKEIREDGIFTVEVDNSCPLFKDLPTKFNVLLTHGDSVTQTGEGIVSIGKSSSGIVTAIRHSKKEIYGIQFHPEVDLTEHGTEIFKNFLYKIANFSGGYTMQNRQDIAIEYIRKTVGSSPVLVLLSGGVDSSVCAALVKKALGAEKIYAIHVDNGFMRKNESENVEKALKCIGVNVTVINARTTFYAAKTIIEEKQTEMLCHTISPEIKRKIIGDTFMAVSEQAMKSFGLNPQNVFLAQGTLRPDLIESANELASSNADVIKTHHNDTQLVRALRKAGRIVEPLRDYHKDEVRRLGEELGLPSELVWRQPFPGPGLSIRIICQGGPYIPDNALHIKEKLKPYSADEIVAHLLPCRSVGVQGDCRSYSSVVALSSSSQPNWNTFFEIAKKIPKEIHGVNRIIYVFGSIVKEVDGITPTFLTTEAIAQLQHADDIVNQILYENKLVRSISQVPVILFPIDFGEKGKRSICIRPFMTNDFMTGVPAVPGKDIPFKVLQAIVERILKEVPEIARVCYDLTSKPPGTTEWE